MKKAYFQEIKGSFKKKKKIGKLFLAQLMLPCITRPADILLSVVIAIRVNRLFRSNNCSLYLTAISEHTFIVHNTTICFPQTWTLQSPQVFVSFGSFTALLKRDLNMQMSPQEVFSPHILLSKGQTKVILNYSW